ncbi:hypothetical protein [Luteibacter sp. Lutesp34]|uniref:hypothetical protein n=1 Tax=Luteibacter sp. Lutesp34 TaxID=3243030 RepID=UPI0039B388DA
MSTSHMVDERRRSYVIRGALLLMLLWLGVSAYGIWRYASQETEPPVFDALSYVQKAQAFWSAVNEHGIFFNPLDLAPQIRPFGTVFFTHPYGFTEDFRPFYFFSSFFPALILAFAMLVAAGRTAWRDSRSVWVLCVLLVVSASLPSYYQFASAEGVPVMGSWGFVDTLFGAIGAVGIAFATRSVPERWMRDTVLSAAIAALTIFIKPAALTLMMLIAGAWGLMALGLLYRRKISPRTFWRGLAIYAGSYALVAAILYHSAYFSKENYLYGLSSMKLLHAAQIHAPTLSQITEKLKLAFGVPCLVLVLAGLVCAAFQRHWDRLGVAIVCLIGGTWLWLGQTNIEHVRYFFPFPVMALACVVPSLIWISLRVRGVIVACSALLLIPTGVVGLLLLEPLPSPEMQRVMGLNLSTNLHSEEVRQGRELSELLSREPGRVSIIYYCGVAPKVKAFEAVMDWNRVLGLKGGNSNPALPIDWVREHAYRLDEMLAARFLVFQPYEYPDAIAATIRVADDFDKEQALVRAWLTTLGAASGVRVVSDGGVRVLEILDPSAVARSARRRLLPGHTFRQVFYDGFTLPDTVSEGTIRGLDGNLAHEPISLYFGATLVATIRGVTVTPQADGTSKVDVYATQESPMPKSDSQWLLFVHTKDGQGELTQAYVPFHETTAQLNTLVHYVLSLPAGPRKPSSYAIGVFSHAPGRDDLFLTSKDGEWGGRRYVL